MLKLNISVREQLRMKFMLEKKMICMEKGYTWVIFRIGAGVCCEKGRRGLLGLEKKGEWIVLCEIYIQVNKWY